MVNKKCFVCSHVKSLQHFYAHKQMADGTLNKCKECCKKDVRKNRKVNIDYYRAYDIKRGSRRTQETQHEWRKQNPQKYKAQTMVNNAVRDKRLFKEPCEVCGKRRTHGHHDDYLKPLNVRWLCAIHHREWHDKNGDGKNGAAPG